MLCENCNQNLATAFSSVIIDNDKYELYLCDTCLKNKQNADNSFKLKETISDNDEKLCVCGASFANISESCFVKCKDCYVTFEKELEPVIFALHSSYKHRGKRKLTKYDILFEQLQKARENNFVSLALKIENEIKALKGDEYE